MRLLVNDVVRSVSVVLVALSVAACQRDAERVAPSPTVAPTIAPSQATSVAGTPSERSGNGPRFGDRLILDGVQLGSPTIFPGQPVEIRLVWRSLAPIDQDYRAFVEIVDSTSDVVARDDDVIGTRSHATSTWHVGDEGSHVIRTTMPRRLAAGAYQLRIGVIGDGRQTRLPVSDSAGMEAGDTWVAVSTLRGER